ncbi:hypothetical protein [Streptomyces sp. NPDC060035]|uniref:hypothetical protein n=1 Tax=Streptomyces sp. NPDC060035 TaxID=3347044 RepID=UPI0036A60ED9
MPLLLAAPCSAGGGSTDAKRTGGTALGGPHAYVRQQAQSPPFTVAAPGEGARGRTHDEISDPVLQGLTTALVRIGSAVEKQS